MVRFAVLAAVLAALSGCAAGNLSTSMQLTAGDEPPARSQPALAMDQSENSSGGSMLTNIWDNFSSRFRPDSPPTAQSAVMFEALDGEVALRLVNDYRAKHGLKPLSLDTRATAAASTLAEDMAKHDWMSHYGPDGADVAKRLSMAGYRYHLAAENIGVGQGSLSEIVDGWKKSPPHSKNMLLSDAKHMGIAMARNPNSKLKTFWTLVIAAP